MKNRMLGKYEIVTRLGRGGMAEVYKAYHASLDRYVAIKVLHQFLADDEEFARRFGREAQNIARLKHPNIVQVYDYEYDQDSDSYYMVMELVDGVTLKERLTELHDQGEALIIDEALRITREAASALEYAHRTGMIHRDVKPANLMLDTQDNDRVVLTDFGIAKIVTGSQHTVTGGLVGTPAYMAPEQGVGESGDERSDLYSLGVILYQMVTGTLPFDADTPLALILKHMNDPVPTLDRPGLVVPQRVDGIVHKLLEKEPEDRYQTAASLIDDIREIERALRRNDDTPVKPFQNPAPLLSPDRPDAASQAEQAAPASLPERARTFDGTTISFNRLGSKQKPLPPELRTAEPDSTPPERRGGAGARWLALLLVLLFVLGGGYVLGSQQGIFPAVGFLASPTPSSTSTPTMTVTATATATATPPPTPSAVPETATPIMPAAGIATTAAPPTQTPVPDTPTAIRTATPLPTETPIPDTPTPSITPTPTQTPNATQTRNAQQTATTAACTFDYAIIEQTPSDGDDGGFFETNSEYERIITLFNAGTCPWEINTSLTFVEGVSFNAGPRIFIRETVAVSAEVSVLFSGTLPSTGDSNAPLSGTWQLRTPGGIPIGEPFTISVMVYDPGR